MKIATILLLFSVGALLSLGLVMLSSAGISEGRTQIFLAQLKWCGIGLGAAVVLALVDYRLLRKFAWPIFVVAVALLILVLIPGIGVMKHGARRWFNFAGFSFQPSEAAKLALVIALAAYAERVHRQMRTLFRGLAVPLCFTAVILGLIFVEPDRGTTVLLGAVAGVMLLVAGVRWLYILPPMSCAVVALGFSLWHDPVRARRILSWLHPEEHKQEAGYQAWQSMIAFGSGGWHGLGLGNSRQKFGFIPEHYTDFIFAIIGEELGLVATLGVVLGFGLFVAAGIYIACRARDRFGMLLAAGITFLIGFQALINIGVVTGAFPNKGLPLPFISYGGSNLLLMLACVGVLLSIARRAEDSVEEPVLQSELMVPHPAA